MFRFVTLLSPLTVRRKGASALYIGILSPLHPRRYATKDGASRVPTARNLFAFLSQPLKRLAISVMPILGCWLRISMLAKLELLLVD